MHTFLTIGLTIAIVGFVMLVFAAAGQEEAAAGCGLILFIIGLVISGLVYAFIMGTQAGTQTKEVNHVHCQRNYGLRAHH